MFVPGVESSLYPINAGVNNTVSEDDCVITSASTPLPVSGS